MLKRWCGGGAGTDGAGAAVGAAEAPEDAGTDGAGATEGTAGNPGGGGSCREPVGEADPRPGGARAPASGPRVVAAGAQLYLQEE
jgi:hypothetical protein